MARESAAAAATVAVPGLDDMVFTALADNDEFDSTTLNAQWSLVGYALGTIDSITRPPGGDGLYDLTTEPGFLLLQPKENTNAGFRLDAIPAAGEAYLLTVYIAEPGSAELVNNSIWVGLAFNADNASPTATPNHRFVWDGGDNSFVALVDDNSAFVNRVSNASPPGRLNQFCVTRDGNILRFWWRANAQGAWSPCGLVDLDVETTYNNTWILIQSNAAFSGGNELEAVQIVHSFRHLSASEVPQLYGL